LNAAGTKTGRIYVNAQHLDGLIRDVLDLTRIEVGQLQLSYEPLDMAEGWSQSQ
jgi:signal transduction histidine kinase